MEKMSLDSFKVRISENDEKEVDRLIGGILGACHCTCTGSGRVDLRSEYDIERANMSWWERLWN